MITPGNGKDRRKQINLNLYAKQTKVTIVIQHNFVLDPYKEDIRIFLTNLKRN